MEIQWKSTFKVMSLTKRMKRILFIGMMVLLLHGLAISLAVVEAASGEVIYVDAGATGKADGTSWDDAFTDLHNAIVEAEAGDQIWIAAGTYYPTGNKDGSDERTVHFKMKRDVEIYGGFAGHEDPMEFDLNERNFDDNETILSGDIGVIGDDSDNTYHVFYHGDNPYTGNLEESAVLDGVTITGGNANGGERHFDNGGGMYNDNQDMTLRNVTFKNNKAHMYGGGMYNYISNPKLFNVKIIDNVASQGGGYFSQLGNAELINVESRGNNATQFGGGFFFRDDQAKLVNVLISGNVSQHVGAIYNEDSTLTMINTTISGNKSTLTIGGIGGIQNVGGNISIYNSIVCGNKGLFANDYTGAITFENSFYPGLHKTACDDDPEDLFVEPLDADEAPSYGGNYRLKDTSPALGMGDASFFSDGGSYPHIKTDLEGKPRILDDALDLGAYESPVITVFVDPWFITFGTVLGVGFSDIFYYGDIVTATAVPNENYGFVNWTMDDEILSTEAVLTFEVPAQPFMARANFGPLVEVNVTSSSDSAGTVSGGGEYAIGREITVTATPSEGYHFVGWSEDGDEVSTEASYTFEVPGDRDLVANFALNTYTISATADPAEGGSVAGGGTFTHGHELTVTAAAYPGYTFVNWTESSVVVSTDADYSFEVTEDRALVANFVDLAAPSIILDYSPTTLTRDEVTIKVEVIGESEIEEVKWDTGDRDVTHFATAGTVLLEASFQVSKNGVYTVYAKDKAGKQTVNKIYISNINMNVPLLTLTPSPAVPTNGEVVISVTASVYGADSGNTLVKLNWMAGNLTTVDFAGGTSGEDILGTEKFAVRSNGTYTVYAQDLIGNEVVQTITITNIQDRAPSGGSRTSASTGVADSPVTDPSEDGRRMNVDSSMIEIETQEDGTKIEIVHIDQPTLSKIVEEMIESGKPVLTMRVNDQEDGVKLILPSSFILDMTKTVDQAVINLRLNGASYQLAIQVLDLEHIAKQMGVPVADLVVSLVIEQASDKVVQDIELLASEQGATVVSEVIQFKVIVEAGGQSVEISDFGSTYMPRSMMTAGNSNDQTGVMYDPVTQTFSFIPSLNQTGPDGTKETFLFAPHNSLYLVIESDGKTFADIQGHWAQADIEKLASKFIVNGVSGGEFAPESEITRAEFTALLVRSLGLSAAQKHTDSRFVDVDEEAWYAQVVEIAAKVGLVQGIDADHFAPNEQITREQLAVMVASAMKLAGAPAVAIETDDVLGKYPDQDEIADWARHAAAQTSAVEIIRGYPDGTFAPQQIVTRAEAVAVLKRFLQTVEFID